MFWFLPPALPVPISQKTGSCKIDWGTGDLSLCAHLRPLAWWFRLLICFQPVLSGGQMNSLVDIWNSFVDVLFLINHGNGFYIPFFIVNGSTTVLVCYAPVWICLFLHLWLCVLVIFFIHMSNIWISVISNWPVMLGVKRKIFNQICSYLPCKKVITLCQLFPEVINGYG